MRNKTLLDALIPRTRQGILAATLTQPERAWYVSELARRMRVPPSSLQRELRNLAQAGILKTHTQGRMVYYQANTDSPAFLDLRGLLLKTAGLVDVLAEVLKPLSSKLRVALVFGPIASGDEQADSDIDLMIVGDVSASELALPLRRARERLGREIHPILYATREFKQTRGAKDRLLSRALSGPKLWVLGNEEALGQAAR
jgi:DNA-binding transcriptional ArsR family regulator